MENKVRILINGATNQITVVGPICEKYSCDSISPEGGVCDKCVVNDLNNGDYMRCAAGEDCPGTGFLCDHCGTNASTYILGGEASVFLSCDTCFEVVGEMDPIDRDYTTEQKHEKCELCRD